MTLSSRRGEGLGVLLSEERGSDLLTLSADAVNKSITDTKWM